MSEALIALGANLGQKRQALSEAVERLCDDSRVELVAVSSPLETQPIGVPDSDAGFINQAARFRVDYEPAEWLERMLAVEQALGRARKIRWGARSIDLDLLLFDDVIVRSDPLWVPHPRMGFRRFVMQPAVEIGADMWHPVYQATLGAVWEHLNQAANWIVVQTPWEGTLAVADGLAEGIDLRTVRVAELLRGERASELSDWLGVRPVAGRDTRVVITDDWDLRLEQTFGQPKLVVRLESHESVLTEQTPVRLELVLETDNEERQAVEIRAAVEAMVLT